MVDTAGDMVQMIGVYTDQIQRYESLSTWYAAFSAACILAVIIFMAILSIKRKNEGGEKRQLYNGLLSCISLMIPSITTLYLYVFAMNMRKVALYRGYLGFLEKQWNSLAGSDLMLFDGEIIGNFFSFRSFLVNGLGPGVMAVFVLIAVLVGFGLSIYFGRQLDTSRFRKALGALICVLFLVCVSFDGLCTYYLSTNDQLVEDVINHCER